MAKLARLAESSAVMVHSLQKNGQSTIFSQKDQIQINISDYLNWLLEFWNNNLFFKHRISWEGLFENPRINLLLPPFYLTLCLEQGISNAVEAYQESDAPGKHRLLIETCHLDKGVKIIVTSFAPFPDLDPWVEGTSFKPGHLGMGLPVGSFLARKMGWGLDLKRDTSSTDFMILIPDPASSVH